MTMKIKPINKEKIPNELRIKTCKDCGGNPPERSFDTGKHIGKACDTCFAIISWSLKPKTKK